MVVRVGRGTAKIGPAQLGRLVADTNIIVRLLVNDDPAQVHQIRSAIAGHTVWVGVTVLLECAWVLGSRYQVKRAGLADAFEKLLATDIFEIEDHDAVAMAIGWFRQQGDFVDALHLARTRHKGEMLTLDAGFCKAADAPVRVLTLRTSD